MTAVEETVNERPDYDGSSPRQRAVRRFLGIMAYGAGQLLNGRVVMADDRHNLFKNYDQMRELSKCTDVPEGLAFLSTDPDNARDFISGPKNGAAITRDFTGLCWRGEHKTDAETGEVVWGIEWTLNCFNGAVWAGARHLDREITSAAGHEMELHEIERVAPQAAKNTFKKLEEHAGQRLTRLLGDKERHRLLIAAGEVRELPPG